MSWRFRFARGLDWFVAICSLVFLHRYANFLVCELACRSDCLLHSRNRTPLASLDAIAAVANDLMRRLMRDPQLGRFWTHRGDDGLAREKQLLVDFLCASAGGPLYYRGRDMKRTHIGMRISNSDWTLFIGHLTATLEKLNVPERERQDVFAFVESTKADIVEMA